jgi:hypothetical protein
MRMKQESGQHRGRGRPATGLTPKRYFRMDDDSWEQIVQASTIENETTSEYVRRILLRDAKRVLSKRS